jgi:plastocyanin
MKSFFGRFVRIELKPSLIASMVFPIAAMLVSAPQASAVIFDGGWGTLKGQIVVSGDVPEIPVENVGDGPDKEACLVDGVIPKDDNLVVSEEGQLRDVFVMMVTKGKGENAPIHQSYDAEPDEDSEDVLCIDNVACRFVPHALYVRAGQSVKLKNSDTVGHNCHIITFTNEHNINLPAGGDVDVVLENSHKTPGQVKCDIHKWMDGVILVRDNPYVAITDEQGNFEILNVPEGEWEFQFWHKKGAYLKKLKVDGYKVSRKGIIDVKIEADGELDLGKMEVPGDSLNK